jgi:dTDP-4-amino-4,6-dideoxygalactose transaminase
MIYCANPSAQYQSYKKDIDLAISNVLISNRYILGSEVSALEKEFAAFIGVSSAIGVANGTDALEIALRALEIGPGDEVITVSHTAVATVAAIEAIGAIPVLVDVDAETYTLSPEKLNEAYSSETKAVIAVHIYGQSCDLDKISSFCLEKNIFLIEDVSQAHGALYQGKRLGSIGIVSCFSCYPTKNLGAVGDAGLVCTNDLNLATKIKMIREYGWRERYISEIPGRNSRLDEVQAAILRIKLRNLDSDNNKRISIAKRYSEKLNLPEIELPITRDGNKHVYHLYVIKIQNRGDLVSYLQGKEIFPGIHYPVPIHQQAAYQNRIRTSTSMSITEKLSEVVLSLPIYPELSTSDVDKVVQSILDYFKKA